ncbi:unnamed protein product [Vitrella brassicaformis CCMP3155]|uniref:Methyltransferase type 11 domain-containing protein n=2 Tax=Vitrella brassicaformis TaxID=1169539 RepID=A0A0G4EW75_VITBC|nr:unnamed protein product [Vitrella brassicaformis CCMP3155]|mmetsp:Transcript_33034/g.81805  ORF Transcript_33034/g.81805 Transcript_33034/m.81805 type:complete len:356 (+) Transcript_33034:134-1201(+)|eukprot:CEM02498.1 unnamed protein product [Vitrella brassicaformis CCMP3155]
MDASKAHPLLPLFASSMFLTFGGALAGGWLISRKPDKRQLPDETSRRETFDKKAHRWDKDVRTDEFFMGIGRWRRSMCERAEGHVLETAVGTGRNFAFYNTAKVKSVVATDFSRKMLKVASTKKKFLDPIPSRFVASNSLKLDFGDDTFDTVVDTFGICSYEKPVETINEMARVMKPSGKMLLLEHGAGTGNAINWWLRSNLVHHVHKYGCYHNRKIDHIVKLAGLDVTEVERRHAGTSYMIIATKSCSGAPLMRTPSQLKADEERELSEATADEVNPERFFALPGAAFREVYEDLPPPEERSIMGNFAMSIYEDLAKKVRLIWPDKKDDEDEDSFEDGREEQTLVPSASEKDSE